MVTQDDRFNKPWGTPEEVEAAYRAGWPIDQGPPPFKHTLPPEHTVEAEGPHGKFKHNGVEVTDARPLFINDTYEEPTHG